MACNIRRAHQGQLRVGRALQAVQGEPQRVRLLGCGFLGHEQKTLDRSGVFVGTSSRYRLTRFFLRTTVQTQTITTLAITELCLAIARATSIAILSKRGQFKFESVNLHTR